MKYIEADKIKAEIKRIMAEEMEMFSEQCQGGEEPNAANAVVYTRMQMLLSFIDQMQQEEPLPPGIENESQKKGWLDYGLTMSEIGLHRYNPPHQGAQGTVRPPYHPRPLSCRRILRVCWCGENLLLPAEILHGLPI